MISREPEDTNSYESEFDEEVCSESDSDFQESLAEIKQKAEEYLASWQRTQADFINYKRHVEQERLENAKYANSKLILSILPVVDDFDRALESFDTKTSKSDWAEGIKLIVRKLKTTLESIGVSPIEALGEPFDPNLHEAVMHSTGEDGIVIEEVKKGYKLHDRVIRPSHVIVGNGESEEDEEDFE